MDVELSIVVPAYNEEESVELCYREITDSLESLGINYEIIFVDDGSTDLTFKKLYDLSKNDEKLKVIKLRKNFGQSAALRTGLDHSSGRIIVTMDADLQNDPKDIPKLLETLKEENSDQKKRSIRKTFTKKQS